MRIAFGLSMDGSTQPPRVDGLELTDLEWQVWHSCACYSISIDVYSGDAAVRKLRAHFGRRPEGTDDETA